MVFVLSVQMNVAATGCSSLQRLRGLFLSDSPLRFYAKQTYPKLRAQRLFSGRRGGQSDEPSNLHWSSWLNGGVSSPKALSPDDEGHARRLSLTTLDKRRRSLLWCARSRQWPEMDSIIAGFAEQYVANLSTRQVEEFEFLLSMDNDVLFEWFSGQAEIPEEMSNNEVLHMILRFVSGRHPGLRR
mmetsp:Transcript_55606/g.121547  ORF Transcript_55606/g.121547 Transcript_55606/m.121547 type:complete len:185 (-) Transcript_55606:392-946(-)